MKTHSKDETAARSASTPWLARTGALALVVFVLACALYAATLRNGFVWDDVNLIVDNPGVRALDGPTVKRLFTSNYWDVAVETSGLYRPLSALSFHTDYRLYGLKPAGFHLTNILLNGGVCVLVLLLLVQLFGHMPTALVAALVFAALPVHTENVAWIAGRTDVMAALFMLAAVATYLRWRRRGSVPGLILALACFAAALLCKETAAVLPPLILVLEFGPFVRITGRRAGRARRVLAPLAFFVLAALYFALRRHMLGAAVSFFTPFAAGPVNTAALSLSTLAHYVYKLLFPFVLNVESDVAVSGPLWNVHAIAGLAIVVAGVLAVYRWRSRGEVVFAASVFALGLAPVLNIVPVTQVSAERFLYFPSLGFALAVALAVRYGLARWRRPVLLAFAVLICAYSVRTVARTLDWRDEITLFGKTVATAGHNARARVNFGSSLYDHGRYPEAVDQFRRATEISPNYADAWGGLGRALAKVGQTDEAVECMHRGVEIEPDNVLLRTRLGILLLQTGHPADAAEHFRHALVIRPRNPHARYNLALALFLQQDYEGTIRELAALERKDGEFVPAYYFLAEAEARLGRTADAAADATLFLELYDKDDALTRRARELAGR